MKLHNNSKNEWLEYNYGSGTVDIKANSTIEVDEKVGKFLLEMLGHENWLVEVEEVKEDKKPKEIKKVVKKVVKKPKKKVTKK